ncbi:hypothetical protein [Streptomyces sp. NPDC020681]|uniref:hypothetical protein n=1 Tax=Streptomyces sp. NPDC020681 TaxID=3365083 RepID=UPI0037918B48
MNPTETEETKDATTGPAAKTPAEPAESATDKDVADSAGLDDDAEDTADSPEDAEVTPVASGLGAAAAGVVSAGLGVVALSGSWVGKVASERQTLIGQIKTSQGGNASQQISAIYGDAWHTTALVNGVFAFLALVVGLVVLTRPQQPGWVRAFAVAGAALGALGVLFSIGMYFDLFLSLPSAGS